jgi:hypothetical protein
MTRGALCTTESCLDNPVDGGTPPQFCYDAPPCRPYGVDYRVCVDLVKDAAMGQCAAALQACNDDPSGQCAQYQTCNNGCATWPACQACASKYPTGEVLWEAYQRCVENTCLAQGWVIHVF